MGGMVGESLRAGETTPPISDIYFVIITGVNFGPLFDCFYHFATGQWVVLGWAYGAKFDPLRFPSFEIALAVGN